MTDMTDGRGGCDGGEQGSGQAANLKHDEQAVAAVGPEQEQVPQMWRRQSYIQGG